MTDLPSATSSDEPPLDPEPVLGWRVWRLVRRGGELRLLSLTRDEVWPPRDAMRATCDRQPNHQAPSPSCSCGLYAADSPGALAGAGVFGFGVAVAGPVAMWGTVVKHEHGARSAFAYPARLRLICSQCIRSGRPTTSLFDVVETGEGIEPVCDKHETGVVGIRRDAGEIQSELLSTYAVDLLPAEQVAKMHVRFAAPSPVRPIDMLATVGTWAIQLLALAVQLVMFLMLAGWVLAIAVGVWGIVTAPFRDDEPVATIAPAVVSPVGYTSIDEPRAQSRREDPGRRTSRGPSPSLDRLDAFPPLEFTCGIGAGEHVHLVPCDDRESDLLGVAEQDAPHGARVDCVDDWVAYSRGDTYWVCWHALGRSGHVNVRPWAPTDADPFGYET